MEKSLRKIAIENSIRENHTEYGLLLAEISSSSSLTISKVVGNVRQIRYYTELLKEIRCYRRLISANSIKPT